MPFGRDNKQNQDTGGQALFTDDERRDFRKDDDGAPQIYDPGKHVKPDGLDEHLSHRPRLGINLRKGDRVSPYEDELDRKRAMDPRTRHVLYLCLTLVLVFIAVILLPNYMFDVNNKNLSLAWIINITQRNFSNLVTFISGAGAYGSIDFVIIRFVIVGLAGAALSISGTAFQGSLKNQMASPSTLGVMSGAQLGAIIFILLSSFGIIPSYTATGSTLMQQSNSVFANMNPLEYIWAVSQQGFFSIAGSALVVALVLFISYLTGHGKTSRIAMVITGQVIAALVSSFIVVVRMYIQEYGSENQIDALSNIMVGGFNGTFTLTSLLVVGVPIIICIAIIILLRNKLNLLAFDETEARSMGISTTAVRTALVACCTIMTGVVIAFCGPVGYIGFLVPHLTRRIVGPDFKYLVPASGLVGAIFLLLIYYLFTNFTIPSGSISMVTTIFGVFAFIVTIFRQRRSGYASW